MRRVRVAIAAASVGLLAALPAGAGGPLAVRANGLPYLWSTAAPIAYRTDDGPLSNAVNEPAARTRVQSMFAVWQNVASASISYNRAGFIQDVGAFTDGDVSTAVEFDAVEGACGNGSQSPIIYDATGEIFEDVIADDSVIGFAGPCALEIGPGLILTGLAVMNGLYQDGEDAPIPDLTTAEFDATFIHEFGHFSGLDHSQVNVSCAHANCAGDRLEGLPTMFPFLVSDAQIDLSVDDIAWISMLYPAAGPGGFDASHGTVTGRVFFTDGESQAQGVNVVARPLDDPGTPEDERLTMAASNVSGYRFRFFHGNSITTDIPQVNPSAFGSTNPALIGFYEIPLPPGDYTIELETVDPSFVEGSSVGGPIRLPMPGLAPAPIPVTIQTGVIVGADDAVLISTPPRFDVFEGP